jgi:hypothetical protein
MTPSNTSKPADTVAEGNGVGAETITGVAMIYDDGRVFALPRPHRHHHLYALAAFLGQQPTAEHDTGFTTSTGRYVGREEAQRICAAAGQPNRRSGSPTDPKLYSEDVW